MGWKKGRGFQCFYFGTNGGSVGGEGGEGKEGPLNERFCVGKEIYPIFFFFFCAGVFVLIYYSNFVVIIPYPRHMSHSIFFRFFSFPASNNGARK